MIFTFQVEMKEPLHTGQLIKLLPNWPLVPFYYDKRLWKIEFNSDFSLFKLKLKKPLIGLWTNKKGLFKC